VFFLAVTLTFMKTSDIIYQLGCCRKQKSPENAYFKAKNGINLVNNYK